MKITGTLLLSAGLALLLIPLGGVEKGFRVAAARDGQVTFTKDVAPIFYQRCAECHRLGEIAPMSLLLFENRAGCFSLHWA